MLEGVETFGDGGQLVVKDLEAVLEVGADGGEAHVLRQQAPALSLETDVRRPGL